MNASGCYSAKNFPGEAALTLARKLAAHPDFQHEGATDALFNWDTDTIILLSEEGNSLAEMPLRETFKEYAGKL